MTGKRGTGTPFLYWLSFFIMQTVVELKQIESNDKKPEVVGNNMEQNDVESVEEVKVETPTKEIPVSEETSGDLSATAVDVVFRFKHRLPLI